MTEWSEPTDPKAAFKDGIGCLISLSAILLGIILMGLIVRAWQWAF